MHFVPAIAAVSINRTCENKNYSQKGQQLFKKTCHAAYPPYIIIYSCIRFMYIRCPKAQRHVPLYQFYPLSCTFS